MLATKVMSQRRWKSHVFKLITLVLIVSSFSVHVTLVLRAFARFSVVAVSSVAIRVLAVTSS